MFAALGKWIIEIFMNKIFAYLVSWFKGVEAEQAQKKISEEELVAHKKAVESGSLEDIEKSASDILNGRNP